MTARSVGRPAATLQLCLRLVLLLMQQALEAPLDRLIVSWQTLRRPNWSLPLLLK